MPSVLGARFAAWLCAGSAAFASGVDPGLRGLGHRSSPEAVASSVCMLVLQPVIEVIKAAIKAVIAAAFETGHALKHTLRQARRSAFQNCHHALAARRADRDQSARGAGRLVVLREHLCESGDDPAALPSRGCFCSRCNGEVWWCERKVPRGWRCTACLRPSCVHKHVMSGR